MPLVDKLLLYKHGIIESIDDQLKNISQTEHTRHRSSGILQPISQGHWRLIFCNPKIGFLMGSLSHTDIILKEVYCHSTEKFSVCYRASNMNKHLLGGNHDFYRYSDVSYAPCHPGIFTRSTRHHLLGEAVLFNGMPRSSLSSHCDSGWILRLVGIGTFNIHQPWFSRCQ